MEKKAILSSLGLLLGSRLAGNTVSTLARSTKSPLRNFYTRMARRGFEDGFTNAQREILPTWRRPLLTRFGPTTGLLDYDASKFLGSDVASKIDKFKKLTNNLNLPNEEILKRLNESSLYNMSRSLGLRPRQLVQQYKELPLDYQQMIRSKGQSEFSSPLFRHISDAINYGRPATAPTFIERNVLPLMYGASKPSNVFNKTVGLSALNSGTQDAVFSSLVSGRPVSGLLQGLATGIAESAPEATALQLANSGKLKTLTALKSNLINTGYQSVQNPTFANRAIANTTGVLDSNMKEFVQMGKDLAKPFKNKTDNLIKNKAMEAVEQHGSPAHLRQAIKEDLVNPFVKRIKTLAPDLYDQATYSYM
jgi:hypothetical protein